MITKYQIPCSTCGKLVERYVFCSGACRVKGHRERGNGPVTVKEIEPQKEPPGVVAPYPEELSMWSDKPKDGYKFVPYLGRYRKQ